MTGFDASSADCIAYLDADDEWDPDFLAISLSLMERFPRCSAAGTARRIVDNEKVTIPPLLEWNAFSGPIDLSVFVKMRTLNLAPLRVPCSVFQRQSIVEAGGFIHAVRSSDVDFMYRFFLAGEEYAFSAEPKATIHRVPGSTMNVVRNLSVRRWRLTALEAVHAGKLEESERQLISADIRRSVRSDAIHALRAGRYAPPWLPEARASLPVPEWLMLTLATRLPSRLQVFLAPLYRWILLLRQLSSRASS
jgi:glycosyltransferase involved in cell wall biosynthesis